MAKENFKNLHSIKINKILCCLAKSKDPKVMFEGSFLFTSVAMIIFFLIYVIFASFITLDKDTCFLLGFHSAGINSNILAILTPVKRAHVHFLALGLKGAECSFNIDQPFYLPKYGSMKSILRMVPGTTPET